MAADMESCYMPNLGTQFGLDFGTELASAPATPPLSSAGAQSQFSSQCVWNFSPDEMSSFPISPLDLQDSVSNFFTFSPCPSTSSNNGSNCRNDLGCFLSKQSSSSEIKQPHDMADVLLSLKHAIVHPGQLSPVCSPPACYQNNQPCSFNSGTSASLSCTVYPHQITPLLQDNDACDNMNFSQPQYSSYGNSLQESGTMSPRYGNGLAWNNHSQPFFPTMSVNVSMNMTMHGYPAPTPIVDNGQPQIPCPQFQWTSSITPSTSPIYQSGFSPGIQPCPAYSFTTDIKPSPLQSDFIHVPTPSPFKFYHKPCYPPTPSPIRRSRRKSMTPLLLDYDDKDKPNLCRICGKTYARPSTLKTHLRTHSGEKPYRCEDCNKSFSQAANLTAHVRTHSGEKPFKCPICGRRFSQSSSVTTHMRTHSGERPYRCKMCKKAFSDSSTLTKHLRIHSGEKPYQCKLCQLRFSQSGNLNRHMRVHAMTGVNMLLT